MTLNKNVYFFSGSQKTIVLRKSIEEKTRFLAIWCEMCFFNETSTQLQTL